MGLWKTNKSVVQQPVWGWQAWDWQRWQPPSAIEQQLLEAKSRGDWAGYLDVAGHADLFFADRRARADAHPDTVRFSPQWNPHLRAEYLALFTEGILPPPDPELVFQSMTLEWYASVWDEEEAPWIAINPGTPCEAYLPAATPEARAVWRRHADDRDGGTGGCDHAHPHGRLRGLSVGGPSQGPVAHGLACAALLFVKNGELWNSMAHHGMGYNQEKRRLKEWWGVTCREEWASTQKRLLDADMVSPVWEFALGIRRSLAQDFAGAVELDHWRQVAERVLRHAAAEAAEPRLTPDGVLPARPGSAAEVEAQVAGVQRLIGRIARYEARFRADGLLADNAFVRSVEAWDYGRASAMARWGLSTRYCTPQEAEQAVVAAGRACRQNYRSWREFSAAYILGRCLHFDEEEFGRWYEDMLTAHRLLTTDPASPWLTIPWN
ncbi:DUF1266 domain-containing protein [Streptomyces luomodiensis]|uniref:DUF1266 domain-containing protein n=1 Tax=Streptomyces luomodiensis TaxID=3026192 RepID=A0ABY9V8F9_9ACTN|nr:DUF1266 domain-containing protein [Streptomyces sp. SCA4-21]WNF01196.1 DUF1266 domain-containing protein [Streptomyces sp. SCA4-21]